MLVLSLSNKILIYRTAHTYHAFLLWFYEDTAMTIGHSDQF